MIITKMEFKANLNNKTKIEKEFESNDKNITIQLL